MGFIYVFVSGNGGFYGDDCNFDGYVNFIYFIMIGVVDFVGLWFVYLEYCLVNFVVMYSSGSGEYIV